MKLNIKVDRRISALRPTLYDGSDKKSFDAEHLKRRLSGAGGEQSDQQKIRSLKDRLMLVEKELQRTREESFQAGFEEGKERGLAEAAKQIDQLHAQIQSIEEQFGKAIAKMEIPLLKLARKMAERILKRELVNDVESDDLIMENLRKGLHELIEENKVLVRVNPEHLKMLLKMNLNQELNLPGTMDVSLVGDKNLETGELVLESENYVMNATYKGQLDHLEDQVLGEASE